MFLANWLTAGAGLTHGGLLNDRLLIAGSDDPLLYRLINEYAQDVEDRALISYTATGTRLGLDLLQARRVDACAIHWGPMGRATRAIRHCCASTAAIRSGC